MAYYLTFLRSKKFFRIKVYKQLTYLFLSFGLLIVFFSNSNSFTNSGGAPEGYTGSPGDGQMTCMSCHGSNTLSLVSPPTLSISSDIVEYYVPDELSYFTISATGE